MKLLNFFLTLVLFALFSCKSNTKTPDSIEGINIPVTTYMVEIDGMTCTGCEQTIQSIVNDLEGVKNTTASHIKGQAVVVVEQGKFDTVSIRKKIEKSGYTVLGFHTISEEEISTKSQNKTHE